MMRKGLWRPLLWTAVAAMGASLIAACSSSGSGSGSDGGAYTVGSSTDLSGSLSSIGTALRAGYEAYFGYVNQHGGIDGHHVNLIALDDASDPTTGVANTKQLTENDHVSAEFVFLSNVIAAAAPMLEETHTAAIVQAATPSLLHPVQPDIFAGDIIIGDEPAPMFSFLKTKVGTSAPSVGLIELQTTALSTFVTGTQQQAKENGWPLAINEQVPLTATTAASQATALAAKKPGVVVMGLVDNLAVSAVTTLRDDGYHGIIVNYDGGSALSTLQKLKDPNFYVVRPFPYAGASSAGSGMTAFENAAKAANVDPNEPFVVNGYLQASLLGRALKACGYPCSAAKTQQELQDLGSASTDGLTFGPWMWSDSNHAGIQDVEIYRWDPSTGASVAVSAALPIASS